MKKILKLFVCMCVVGQVFGGVISHAEDSYLPNNEIIEEYQEAHFFIDGENLQCLTSSGVAKAKVDVEGRVQWDEGYSGWFTSVDIQIQSATLGGQLYTPVAMGGVTLYQDTAYRRYSINGAIVKIIVSADEWGDVGVSMQAD